MVVAAAAAGTNRYCPNAVFSGNRNSILHRAISQ